jgi:hypothetical protein
VPSLSSFLVRCLKWYLVTGFGSQIDCLNMDVPDHYCPPQDAAQYCDQSVRSAKRFWRHSGLSSELVGLFGTSTLLARSMLHGSGPRWFFTYSSRYTEAA